MRPIRVGTRRSRLARAQTELVLRRLVRAHGRRFEAVPIETSGDRDKTPGSSPNFTDAIDRALELGEIDLAVHSAKDLPATPDRRFVLAACPRRADPRDCLVVATGHPRGRLPTGARVGSSSLRRRAQLQRWRPDLTVVEIRGNVDTRIGLVRSGTVDAAILAVAGVARLHRADEITRVLSPRAFVPAPAQGALAVLARADATDLIRVVRRIDHAASRACVTAEQAFSAALGGDCSVPLGALARVHGRTLSLTGEVLTPDGRGRIRARGVGSSARAEAVGRELGATLIRRGALRMRAVDPG
jgi:hydroxymethylbilane synthase